MNETDGVPKPSDFELEVADRRRIRASLLYEETVRGTIIGAMTWRYEFWTEPSKWISDKPERIARGNFENDREAEAWFKKHHSEHYAKGVEMRCFDQD